jgi:hypothetical protein
MSVGPVARNEATGEFFDGVVIPARGGDGDPVPPPRIPAIGELEEGLWWWSTLVGADPEALVEGLPMRLAYDRAEGGEAVPVFVLNSST